MPIVLAAIPAAVTAAAGKAAAGVGITAAGTAAGYGVITGYSEGRGTYNPNK